MINVFAGKVRKTGFFQKAGFPGNSVRIFGIYSMFPRNSSREGEEMPGTKIGIFRPGDHRSKPNDPARPNAEVLCAER
jgi:hypothetical protein